MRPACASFNAHSWREQHRNDRIVAHVQRAAKQDCSADDVILSCPLILAGALADVRVS